MRRRDFIAGLAGAAVSWPPAARAQQPVLPVIGFLDSGLASPQAGFLVAFRQGLADAGYIEGKNVIIEYRRAGHQLGKLPGLARDLVSRQVAVIVASDAAATGIAARNETSAIPIVLVGGVDPMKYGFVDSLNQPGGNVTGVTFIEGTLAGKRLDLLREMVPQVTCIAYLSGGSGTLTFEEESSNLLAAAAATGRELIVIPSVEGSDLDRAFATVIDRMAGALIVGIQPIMAEYGKRILEFAAQRKIPAIYPSSSFVRNGGLMSYDAEVNSLYRLAGSQYVARILKGVKPAELPVMQPTKFELVVNLKTAKALGLTIPETLLATADEVIQ
jgi:putative tryptophan/tyrosine transport system substrate-binding protein